MNKLRIVLFSLILTASVVALFFLWPQTPLINIDKALIDSLLSQEKTQVFISQPLIRDKIEQDSYLNPKAVIDWTNVSRKDNNVSFLSENERLNTAAEMKLQDMFRFQYFEHISPAGLGIEIFAQTAGYDFLLIGENLALGNFTDEKELVSEWMKSPGHRENIINPAYQEIGVAARKGLLSGNDVWVIVQVFGLPSSVCPQIDKSVLLEIEEKEELLLKIEQEINVLLEEIRKIRPKIGSYYNLKIEEYNLLVKEYNDLLSEIKSLISFYNDKVEAFNQCLEQESF